MSNTINWTTVGQALAEPFPAEDIAWKPQTISKDGKRCLAVAYISARLVMVRLDSVVGPGNWKNELFDLGNGTVKCRLSIRWDGEWVSKEDVGGESEQSDPGDRRKSAVSDSVKRVGVLWGIARYLYDLPKTWVPLDEHKRIMAPPQLPSWAVPGGRAAAGLPKPAQDSSEAAKVGQKPIPADSSAQTQSCAEGQGITETQWKTLADILRARDIPPARFLAHFQVQKPRQLPASRFEEAFQLVSAPESVLLAKASAK
jgi:hypothetical protein